MRVMEYCPQVWRRRPRVIAALSGLLLLPALSCAAQLADPAAPKPRFGTSVDELGFPSLGRVILVFVLTVALAVGAVLVMRRFWPALLKRKSAASSIRTLDRAAICATLTLHVVEVEGVKMVVAEGRAGVSLALLPSTPPVNTDTTS